MDLAERLIDVCGLARRGAPDHADDVLEHQHEGESQQQLEMLVAVVDEAQHALDHRPEHRRQQQTAADQDRYVCEDRHMQPERPGERRDAEIGADRVERAARQIDDLLDAENDLQPARDQKKDGGVECAADQNVDA